jgi:hypothetical protein
VPDSSLRFPRCGSISPPVPRRRPDLKPARLALTFIVLAHLVLALGMAANHALHEWIHGEAEHAEHECVVKLLLYGGCDTAAVEEPVIAALPLAREAAPVLVLADVPSVFLSGAVLEHAPPRRG